MKKWAIIISILAIVVIVFAGFFIVKKYRAGKNLTAKTSSQTDISTPSTSSPQPSSATSQSVPAFAEPVANFKSRVTKKPFGIYITPQDSPVQPERFTGYHTGADAEYQDVSTDVPVFAIADCKIVLSKTASGYGGVFMINFDLNGATHTALYGHIRPGSLPKVGQSFKKGDQIALLGTGYSSETDGERRHLHFAIRADNSLNIKGYVSNKSDLSGWIDPLTLF